MAKLGELMAPADMKTQHIKDCLAEIKRRRICGRGEGKTWQRALELELAARGEL